jgi:hypothetical protein
MSDDDIHALIDAHWNEFVFEELVRTQGDVHGREAEEIGQLQLTIHKLKRARLEVACYLAAISRVANTIRAAHRHATGESSSPPTKAILMSHQVKHRRFVLDNDTPDPCWQGRQQVGIGIATKKVSDFLYLITTLPAGKDDRTTARHVYVHRAFLSMLSILYSILLVLDYDT